MVAHVDVHELCERVRVLLEAGDSHVVVCDVGGLVDVDAGTVDVLARLQLTARRLGRQVPLLLASCELLELLTLGGSATSCRWRTGYGSRWGGRPNSGNSLAVSRNELSPTMRPADTSSTCNAHGSWRPPGPLGRY